jgi:hypothetical protein
VLLNLQVTSAPLAKRGVSQDLPTAKTRRTYVLSFSMLSLALRLGEFCFLFTGATLLFSCAKQGLRGSVFKQRKQNPASNSSSPRFAAGTWKRSTGGSSSVAHHEDHLADQAEPKRLKRSLKPFAGDLHYGNGRG